MRTLITPILYALAMMNPVEARNLRSNETVPGPLGMPPIPPSESTYCFGEPGSGMAIKFADIEKSKGAISASIAACHATVNSASCPDNSQDEVLCSYSSRGDKFSLHGLTNANTDPSLKACIESELKDKCPPSDHFVAILIGSLVGACGLAVISCAACHECSRSGLFRSQDPQRQPLLQPVLPANANPPVSIASGAAAGAAICAGPAL